MKKITMIVFIMAAAISMMPFASPAYSMEYILGAKAGYYAWEPFLKETGGAGFADIDRGTGVLYGPIGSILFTPDISLSVSGLFGKQSTYWQTDYKYYPSNNAYIQGTYYFEAKRIDLDSALSYRIIDNLKIFGGYKYLELDLKIKYTELRTDSAKTISEIYASKMAFTIPYHGPAIGIGYAAHIGKGYFAAANLSGVYMWGNIKDFSGVSTSYSSSGGNLSTPNEEGGKPLSSTKIKQSGINFEPSIGYSPGKGMPIFTLGFRYQWFSVKSKSFEEEKEKTYNDYLYGVFISVMYVL